MVLKVAEKDKEKLPLAYKLAMARTVLSGLCLLKGQRHQVGAELKSQVVMSVYLLLSFSLSSLE